MEKQVIIRKKEKVERLVEKLKKAVSFYIVDFTGLNANEMNNLRRRFKNNNFEYFVTKNTILRLASEKLGFEQISEIITGVNAISISYEDPIGPAKIIAGFYKEKNLLSMKLCYIEGQWFSSQDIKKIADLPSKEILLGQLLNLLNSPVNQFVTLMKNILCNFVRVLDEIKGVKEKESKEAEEIIEVKGEPQVKEEVKEEVKEKVKKTKETK